jgi:hypothetical protein
MKRRFLLGAATLGILVPIVTLVAVQWGHAVFGNEILWIYPSSYITVVNEQAAHPWIIEGIAALVNVLLYVLVTYLGGAIYSAIRRI